MLQNVYNKRKEKNEESSLYPILNFAKSGLSRLIQILVLDVELIENSFEKNY